MAHVGLADDDRDDIVGRDADPGVGHEGLRLGEGTAAARQIETHGQAGAGHDGPLEEHATAQAGRLHRVPPASLAAAWMARRIRW